VIGELLERGFPPVVYPPGTVPGASNFGYALLGHLVSSIIVF
jgi:hypothetical protein